MTLSPEVERGMMVGCAIFCALFAVYYWVTIHLLVPCLVFLGVAIMFTYAYYGLPPDEKGERCTMTGKYEEVLAVDYQVLCEKCDRLMRYNGKWVCDECGATVTVHKKVEVCTQ